MGAASSGELGPMDHDTLIYMPTNNCARVMNFVKLNELDQALTIKSPADYGGMNSDEYREINPMGKMPALITAEGATLYESQVILEYLADKHASRLKQPCRPSTLAARTKSRLLIAVHDMYISGPNCTQDGYFGNQGVMYKKNMADDERKARTADLAKQLDVIEGLLDESGPFASGAEISLADCVLYPTYIFVTELAPVALGWPELSARPKSAKWFAHMEAHPVVGKIGADVKGFCAKVLVPNAQAICESMKASL
eukprot:214515-Prymnesium_polylepis.1